MTIDETPAPHSIDSVIDPRKLSDRADLSFDEERYTVTDGEFEHRDTWNGMVVVGVTDAADQLLLVKLADGHGWMLPSGPVEPGDDYVASAATWVEKNTGIRVAVEAAERLRVRHYRTEVGQETTGYHVVFRGSPVDGTELTDHPRLPNQDIETAGWFDEPPKDADWDHPNFEADVRYFLSETDT